MEPKERLGIRGRLLLFARMVLLAFAVGSLVLGLQVREARERATLSLDALTTSLVLETPSSAVVVAPYLAPKAAEVPKAQSTSNETTGENATARSAMPSVPSADPVSWLAYVRVPSPVALVLVTFAYGLVLSLLWIFCRPSKGFRIIRAICMALGIGTGVILAKPELAGGGFLHFDSTWAIGTLALSVGFVGLVSTFYRWGSLLPIALAPLVTTAAFSTINNLLPLATWGNEALRVDGIRSRSDFDGSDESNVYRTEFVQAFGGTSLLGASVETLADLAIETAAIENASAPETSNPLDGESRDAARRFVEAAALFLETDSELEELLESPSQLGVILLDSTATKSVEEAINANGVAGDIAKATLLRGLLEVPRSELLGRLAAHSGVDMAVIPRPATSALSGLSLPEESQFTGRLRGTHPLVSGPPSTEQLGKQLKAVVPSAGADALDGVGVLAHLLGYEIEQLEELPLSAFTRRVNGPIQYATVLLTLIGVGIAVLRYFQQIRFAEWEGREVFPEPARIPGSSFGLERLSYGEALSKWLGLDQRLRNQIKVGPAVRIAHQATRVFLNTKDAYLAQQAADSEKRTAIEEMESQYAWLRYLNWTLPSVGFVGTVLSIGNALLAARGLASAGNPDAVLNAVIGKLGVAFDTTFVALVLSIGLKFLVSFVQRREEETLLRLGERCDHNLIAVLSPESEEFDLYLYKNTKAGHQVEVGYRVRLVSADKVRTGPGSTEWRLLVRATDFTGRTRENERLMAGLRQIPTYGRYMQLLEKELTDDSYKDFLFRHFGLASDGSGRVHTTPERYRELAAELEQREVPTCIEAAARIRELASATEKQIGRMVKATA